MEKSDLMHENGQILHVPTGLEKGGDQTGAGDVQMATRRSGSAASPTGPCESNRRAPRKKVFGPGLPARTERAFVIGAGGPRAAVSWTPPTGAEGQSGPEQGLRKALWRQARPRVPLGPWSKAVLTPREPVTSLRRRGPGVPGQGAAAKAATRGHLAGHRTAPPRRAREAIDQHTKNVVACRVARSRPKHLPLFASARGPTSRAGLASQPGPERGTVSTSPGRHVESAAHRAGRGGAPLPQGRLRGEPQGGASTLQIGAERQGLPGGGWAAQVSACSQQRLCPRARGAGPHVSRRYHAKSAVARAAATGHRGAPRTPRAMPMPVRAQAGHQAAPSRRRATR